MTEELMLLNCAVGELKSPLDCKEIKPSERRSVLSVHGEDCC